MALDRAFPYRIDFENDATATAPAQRVDITDQLASTLDWSSFQWTEMGFGDFLISVPPGAQHFQTTVSMTYNGRTFNVEIEVGFHSETGQLFATFLSIDPTTSLPPDILTGFLPPEDGTGRGMGHISYIVRPRAGLPTGTQIRNVALVTFDLGETIATNQVDDHDPSRGTDPAKEALVTIDALPPTSTVAALPATSPTRFTVSWSGHDDPGGSGIAFYDIYVSDNDGAFVLWLGHTTQTSATFTGVNGHRYGFFSVATDNVGNREATPSGAQATTEVHGPTIITWVNAAGGDWDTPSNWDLGRLPTGGDDVVINIAGITVTHAFARADAVHSLTSQAFISLSAGSLAIAGPSVINATFTISGGTLFLINASLDGSGMLVNQGTLVAQGNSAINVAITTAANSTLRVLGSNAGGATLTVANGFTNFGLIELTSAGAAASATLTVTSGTLTNAAGGSIGFLAGTGGGRILNARFDNQGTFTIAQATTVNTTSATSNSGTINVSGGDLTVNQSGPSPSFTNNGTITIAGGRTFTLSGGVLTNLSGGTLSGGTYNIAGTFQFPGAAITTNAATIVLDGPGSRIIDPSAADAFRNFAANAAGGSFTVQGGRDFATAVAFGNAGVLVVGAGSRFTAAGGLTNFASTTLTGGTFVVAGTLRFPAADVRTNAAAVVLDGPASAIMDLASNDALANFATNAGNGSFTLQNGRAATTAGAFANAGTLLIYGGSTFTVSGPYSQADTGSLYLSGMLNLAAGGSGSGTFTNAGVWTIGGGTFTFSGAYGQMGVLVLPAGAGLNLTGSFSNFSGGTLTDGTYLIGGTFRFANADIRTNAAYLLLDGPAARIADLADNDALANFATNAGNFTIQNGRDFATGLAVTFSNPGLLVVGASSTFTVAGGFSNFAGTTLTGGTFMVAGTLRFAGADIRTNAAALELDGPASRITDLAGNDALANFSNNAHGGSFSVQAGRNFATAASVTFNNVGVLVIAAGSTFTVSGGFANFDGTTLSGGTYLIGGTFQFTGADIRTNAANIVLDGPAAQIVGQSNNDALANFTTNAATGSFTIQNGRNFTPAGAFNNAGTLIIGYGSTFTANGAYTQTGSAIVQGSGTLTLAGGGSNSGSFTVSAGGLVVWVAGTFTLDTGTILGGDGLFQIAGATVRIMDVVSVSNLELDGGVLTGAGALTITNTFTWTGGTMTGTGSTTLAAGSLFTISGAADKVLDGRTLNLGGPTTWSDSGNLILVNNAVINNLSGAAFIILNDQSLLGSGTFNNAGTLIKTTGTGTTTFAAGIAFSNNGGTVNVQSGTLSFAGDYTQNSGDTILAAGATLAAGGTLIILDGTLSGSGTILGNVANSGQINPVGTLTVRGNYTQTARGTLNLSIGGTAPGTGYDQLVVTGLVTLGGTLNVSLVNGFVPNIDDRFQILIFGSRSGDFAVENGLDLGNGLRFDPRYDATSLTLVTTGGNAPPPGPSRSNSKVSWPLTEAEEATVNSVANSPGDRAVWEALALANNGKTARNGLDRFFQLLAENAGAGGQRYGL